MNIIIFGAPGAGKGTHAQIISEKYGLTHISTGELLRQEVASCSPLGFRLKGMMERGELVSDEIVIGLVDQLVTKAAEGLSFAHKGFIFDGFPRTVHQAQALDDILARNGQCLSCVLSIEVPREELIRRIRERAQISNRADDNDVTIAHRLQEYDCKTLPILDYYQGCQILAPVDASGSIEQTRNNVKKILNKLI